MTQANGDYDSIDSELARPRWPFNSPAVGATTTCDLSLARTFVFTVSQATTLAFTNVPSSSFTTRVVCLITNGSAFALTFPASVNWLAGAGPTFRAAGVDVVELVTRDGGTTWYASKMTAGGIVYQNQSLTTASAVEVTLATYALPAGTLAINGHVARITHWGDCSTQQVTLNTYFAGALQAAFNVPSGNRWRFECDIVRTGASAQRAYMKWFIGTSGGTATVTQSDTSPAANLANAQNIDFKGLVTAGGTLNMRAAMVELLVA